MRALEILLERRWILKSREKELYYQIKDELGTVKKFLKKWKRCRRHRRTGWEFKNLPGK